MSYSGFQKRCATYTKEKQNISKIFTNFIYKNEKVSKWKFCWFYGLFLNKKEKILFQYKVKRLRQQQNSRLKSLFVRQKEKVQSVIFVHSYRKEEWIQMKQIFVKNNTHKTCGRLKYRKWNKSKSNGRNRRSLKVLCFNLWRGLPNILKIGNDNFGLQL